MPGESGTVRGLLLGAEEGPLGLRHLCQQLFEPTSFCYPLANLLNKMPWHRQGLGCLLLLPGEERDLMARSFGRAAAGGITALRGRRGQ